MHSAQFQSSQRRRTDGVLDHGGDNYELLGVARS